MASQSNVAFFKCCRTLWIFSNVWPISGTSSKPLVAGPCEFLVMYGMTIDDIKRKNVAGPCEFLVMYGAAPLKPLVSGVAGPCEFLVMYGP